jgi:glycosyltransferase involved in cell wall biosynthesis
MILRISHLSAYDLTGGAGRSAFRLHTGLRRLGQDSRMLVIEKESTEPSVIQFIPRVDLATRARRGLRRRYIERTQGELTNRKPNTGVFSDDRNQYGSETLREILPSDVVHMHWVARFVDYRLFFRDTPKGQPFVWTLHDMNAITGGCHHAWSCKHFAEQCGMCPQFNVPAPDDFSHAAWKRKQRAYRDLVQTRYKIVTPSHWLASEVRRSSLMGNLDVQVIPYGVDTEAFQPRDRLQSRQELGVPADAHVLLFVAQWLGDSYKGMPTLIEALERLKQDRKLFLLVLGRGDAVEQCKIPSRFLGSISDDERLSFVYSAADLFLLPSLEDNFPNTALEALACGLPVVGSKVGGIPEIVRDAETGVLFERGNAEALAQAIQSILPKGEHLRRMSMNCRSAALKEYTLEIQARRYLDLYDTLTKEKPC